MICELEQEIAECHRLMYNRCLAQMIWAGSQESILNPEYPRELQAQFERALVDGEWAKGETVAIRHLAGRFNAATKEMKQVVQAACRKGLLEPLGPDGDDFRVLGLTEARLESVFTHTAKAGFKPTSLVRDVEVEPATPEVAAKLAVEVGSPVYRYVRTRYVEGQPLANQVNYMPYEVCPGLENDDVSRYSFQKLLETKYWTVLAEAEERFLIVPADDQDREVLGLPAGSPVLLIERIVQGPTGWPVVWANIRIRPDRYEYVAALWPQAAELLKAE